MVDKKSTILGKYVFGLSWGLLNDHWPNSIGISSYAQYEVSV